MSFKHFFQFQDKKNKAKGKSTSKETSGPKPKEGLCQIFREGIQMKEEPKFELADQMERGVEFFREANETRINQAFESFDEPMRYALYEIIYLLHVNDPELQEWKYNTFQIGKHSSDKSDLVANLYLENAPCGVKAIGDLSPVFQEDFENYVLKTFNKKVPITRADDDPIEGIYSIGSIGTVGHKNIASDLDLEVQYNLEPSVVDTSGWTDDFLKETLSREHSSLVHRYYLKKGIKSSDVPPGPQRKKVSVFFRKRIGQKYPILFRHLISREQNVENEIRLKNNHKLRHQLILEIISLMKKNLFESKESLKKKEQILRQRIQSIQTYVQTKFPEAEVYLFPFSRQDLQRGYFGSTLDSKESSGGAYELIMSYETLMPGIYFTPVIPSHFIFSQEINNNAKQFETFSDFVQFGLLDFCRDLAGQLNNQGPTPDMDTAYVARHYSAAYWEAFKASSGNLPKATLNILRFEMLLEKNVGKTTIQLIKDSSQLNEFVIASHADSSSAGIGSDHFTPHDVLSLESEFSHLRYDPWWIRYKSLKIAFGTPGVVEGVSGEEQIMISTVIDFAFALHIRLSDVFTKPGDQKEFKKHREKVLKQFFSVVFPEDSERRRKLQATFIGDVKSVNEFETQLRDVFLNSIERIHQKVDKINVHIDEQTSKESEIWRHYYMKSFKPGPNVIQKSILNHLQVPRGRLQIGYRQKEGWFFRSLQKGSTVGKRFESSFLNLLPEEITLIENCYFLNGLVYCVINGYYGIFNKGMLNETKTEIEYDRKHTNLGSKYDNHLAFVRPDQIDRIMKQMVDLFSDSYVSYLDCIHTERTIKEVMIFLNLLKYGRLTLLTRDNLKTIYVDQFDIPTYVENAERNITSVKMTLQAKAMHLLLRKYFRSRRIDPGKVALHTWVNTSSVETTHSATKHETKEKELGKQFHDTILEIHSGIFK
ncbi:MAG: hypothetical protein GY866_14205 [Proteobacteria bacterium]|nr:hypothetical protein [Pseudomonadota bacterium]